jgi:hypothetical protein
MIIETGLTTRMAIATGLDPKVRLVTDIGAKRSASDVLILDGRKDANVRLVAVVRAMMNGSGRSASVPEIADAYDMYEEAAKTAMGFFPSQNVKNITRACVIGVFARASYTEDHEKLEEGATILVEGLGDRGKKGHKSIALLSRYLTSIQITSWGDNHARKVYGYTEAALAAFLANEALTELFVPEEELFALPENKRRSRATKPKLRVVAKAA